MSDQLNNDEPVVPSAEEIEEINRAAHFLPQEAPFSRPCLVVGGVQVYAYFTHSGSLVLSVDFTDADGRLTVGFGEDEMIPTSVYMGDDGPVWETI